MYIGSQVASAMAYLEAHNFIHRCESWKPFFFVIKFIYRQ